MGLQVVRFMHGRLEPLLQPLHNISAVLLCHTTPMRQIARPVLTLLLLD
jgi:hypothetical protein